MRAACWEVEAVVAVVAMVAVVMVVVVVLLVAVVVVAGGNAKRRFCCTATEGATLCWCRPLGGVGVEVGSVVVIRRAWCTLGEGTVWHAYQ